jgi:ribosomal protein S18 acetylase RimI-like enzyme
MIREATRADLVGIHALDRESVEHHHAFDPSFFTIDEDRWLEKRVSQERALLDENEELLVFDDGSGVAGYVWGYVEDRSGVRVGIIQELSVSARRRREGIARSLIRSMLERFGERGCGLCEVVVFSQNDAAVELYEAAGFSKRTCVFRYAFDRS